MDGHVQACSPGNCLNKTTCTHYAGLTGSGKSTLVNCLAGCELRGVTEEEREKLGLPHDAVVVRPVSEGGPRDEVAFIGLSNKSQTEVCALVYCY
jgi:hypothetical protein